MNRPAKLPKSQRDFNYHSLILDSLRLDIQVLRDERGKESKQLNELKGESIDLAYEHRFEKDNRQAQPDEIEYKLVMLHESFESTTEELEQVELQKQRFAEQLEQAAQQYQKLECYFEEKAGGVSIYGKSHC